MMTVCQLYAANRSIRGLVCGYLRAVNENNGGICIDAGLVCAVDIMIFRFKFDGVLVDDRKPGLLKFLTIDGNTVDNRIVEVVKIGSVNCAVVIEEQRTILASLEVRVTARLVRDPKQTATGQNAYRVLRVLVGCHDIFNVYKTITPSAPIGCCGQIAFFAVARITIFCVLQLEIFVDVFATVPDCQICIHCIRPGALRYIDPDTKLGGVSVYRNWFTAVAYIEVTVTGTVIRRIIIIQFQRIIAKTHIAAIGFSRGFNSADIISGNGVVRPQIERISVCTENISGWNCRVIIAGKTVGGRNICGGFVTSKAAVGHDRQGWVFRTFVSLGRTVVNKRIFTPMIMCTGQRTVFIRLEIHQYDRHFADFNGDGSGKLGIIFICSSYGASQRRGAADSGKGIVLHSTDAVRNCPIKISVLVMNISPVALDGQTEIGVCIKVKGDGLARKAECSNIRNGNRCRANNFIAA